MKSNTAGQRPDIKPDLNSYDRFLESSGWLTVSLTWIFSLYSYNSLPDVIPTHFSIDGEADDFSNKSTILILPVIGTILFIGMTILNRFPQIFNYPVKITPENARRQYTLATRMIRLLKLVIPVVFFLITLHITATSNGKSFLPGLWLVPVILAIVNIPLIGYIIEALRAR